MHGVVTGAWLKNRLLSCLYFASKRTTASFLIAIKKWTPLFFLVIKYKQLIKVES